MCEAYGLCPAERNIGNPCLYPDLREIALDCGAPCCSAGICNVSASFPAPTVHRPSDDEARKVFSVWRRRRLKEGGFEISWI